MLTRMRITDDAAEGRRVGDGWDVELGLRWVLLAVPACRCGCTTIPVGTAVYPGEPDLPYLMVVERTFGVADGFIVRAVAHDVPPPSFYAPASWWAVAQ